MSNAAKLILAALLAVALSACGGGGGSSTASAPAGSGTGTVAPPAGPTASPPAGPTAADFALQVSPLPVASGYTGEALGFFTRINEIRVAAGQGVLRQSTALDKAAQAHADYLTRNNVVLDASHAHVETPGAPGFTGVNWYDRFAAAGYQRSQLAIDAGGEYLNNSTSGEKSAAWFFQSPPHAAGMLSGAREIGIGVTFNQRMNSYVFVITLGTSGTARNQLPASDDGFAVVPASGASGIDIRFPITANLRTAATWDAAATDVQVTAAALKDAYGNLVPTNVAAATGATAAPGISVTPRSQFAINPLAVALTPAANLVPGQSYTATISATVKGKALSRTWTFTTLGGSGYTQ